MGSDSSTVSKTLPAMGIQREPHARPAAAFGQQGDILDGSLEDPRRVLVRKCHHPDGHVHPPGVPEDGIQPHGIHGSGALVPPENAGDPELPGPHLGIPGELPDRYGIHGREPQPSNPALLQNATWLSDSIPARQFPNTTKSDRSWIGGFALAQSDAHATRAMDTSRARIHRRMRHWQAESPGKPIGNSLLFPTIHAVTILGG